LGTNDKSQFFDSNVVGNQVIVQDFRGFDRLSSVSGLKVMAKQRQKIREIPRNLFGTIYEISNEGILRPNSSH